MRQIAVASAAAMDALDCGGWVNGGRRSVEGDGLVVCAIAAATGVQQQYDVADGSGHGFVG